VKTDLITRLLARIRHPFWRDPFVPYVRLRRHPSLRRLGTPYGGWTFAAVPELRGCVAISCGLGEDASFDVEFASAFDADMLLVDPTPRAVQHFREIENRLGKPRERPYAPGGKQPAEAYDLTRLRKGQLKLVDKAVSDSVGVVRFYAPRDPEHVSHSIVNFQNDYSESTPYIEVESVDFASLLSMVDAARLQLVKFDIEGAEIRVLEQMLSQGIKPAQICIEFDELGARTRLGQEHFEKSHRLLTRNGYSAAAVDGAANFLYLHSSMH
jgi:FkbM family methyltransferase